MLAQMNVLKTKIKYRIVSQAIFLKNRCGRVGFHYFFIQAKNRCGNFFFFQNSEQYFLKVVLVRLYSSDIIQVRHGHSR